MWFCNKRRTRPCHKNEQRKALSDQSFGSEIFQNGLDQTGISLSIQKHFAFALRRYLSGQPGPDSSPSQAFPRESDRIIGFFSFIQIQSSSTRVLKWMPRLGSDREAFNQQSPIITKHMKEVNVQLRWLNLLYRDLFCNVWRQLTSPKKSGGVNWR